jgi:hypothetical protein
MNGRDGFDRFYLDDDLVFYQQVRSESNLEPDVVVFDRHWMLAVHIEASSAEFVYQDYFVHGFEEAGSERFVHMESGIDYFA